MTIIVGVLVTNHPLRVYIVTMMVRPSLWDMGKSLSDTPEQDTCIRSCTHPLEPIMNTNIICVIY